MNKNIKIQNSFLDIGSRKNLFFFYWLNIYEIHK